MSKEKTAMSSLFFLYVSVVVDKPISLSAITQKTPPSPSVYSAMESTYTDGTVLYQRVSYEP
jgi:hypothetical protein